MRKHLINLSILILVPYVFASCNPSSSVNLEFTTHVAVGATGETVTTMEVKNIGSRTFRDDQNFNGQMQVRDSEGIMQVCREAPELVGPLEPGESHLLASWRGTLPAGTYQVTWGASNYGGVMSSFTIFEREGRLDLDQESMDTKSSETFELLQNCDDFPGHTLPEDSSQDPPPVILNIDGQEQISGIGTYCWTQPDSEAGICADAIGIPTLQEALITSSPFTARFNFTIQQPPDFLQLNIINTAEVEELAFEARGLRWWRFEQAMEYEITEENPAEIKLNLDPGRYILGLFGQWQDFGDVTYGFLVDVQE